MRLIRPSEKPAKVSRTTVIPSVCPNTTHKSMEENDEKCGQS
jgi:hypothetical protein